MANETIHIIDWPKGPAKLEHLFPSPVLLDMFNKEAQPLFINMNMNLAKGEQVIPVCIKLCEPICAESRYKIGINLLGQPFAEITVSGVTKFGACNGGGGNGGTVIP